MKKISILLTAFTVSFCASAKVITVNNNTNSPGQYASLQQAIDSASAGDTIYVHGSPTSYGNVNIKKRLNLFGTGHKPSKTNILVSEIGTLQLDTLSGVSGASGTKINGFVLKDVKGYSGSGGTKNILINRSYFSQGSAVVIVRGSGWTLQNCIFISSYVNVNNHGNLIIRNNIFSNGYITTSNQSTVIINNNIFTGSAYALTSLSNALLANNIFLGCTPNGTGVDNNSFANNLSYQTSNNTIPAGTNIGSGNFVAQDPLFTNVPTNTFNYTYDFTLSATSPGKNAGTDATDLGVYGGTSPFVDLTGTPAIPQVKNLTILNPVISVGDSLQVIIKAKKQN